MTGEQSFTDALVAARPSPDDPGYTLFDAVIGSWTFDMYTHAGERRELAGRGEWRFSWILDGRAVQDVWECYTAGPDSRLLEKGSTVRMYDPHHRQWRIVFFSPVRGMVDLLSASRVGDEIVQQGTGRSGRPSLWIFSEMKKDSFRWRWEESPDHGKTWTLLEEMRLTRRR